MLECQACIDVLDLGFETNFKMGLVDGVSKSNVALGQKQSDVWASVTASWQ